MIRAPTRSHPKAVVPLLLVLLPACSPGESGSTAEGPAGEFETVEERLMEASTSRVDFTITATGAVEVGLEGSLLLAEGGRARLEARGTFGGDEVDLLLVSDGERMRMTNGTDTTETATPPALREALVIGLTRMGVLHNLARLTGPAPPDHSDGDVRDWVEAVDFRTEERGSLGFDIRVSGERTASARLFLAPGTGLPGERRQTVEFTDPEGGVLPMEVTELYGAVSLGAGLEPAEFQLD